MNAKLHLSTVFELMYLIMFHQQHNVCYLLLNLWKFIKICTKCGWKLGSILENDLMI